MKVMKLKVNGGSRQVEVDPETPLLWVLRDALGITSPKYGCGISACGACTVHLDGRAVRACVTPVSEAAGGEVVTLEGLSPGGRHPLQQAWIRERVPQCGYCQAGQIMQAAELLRETPDPTEEQIREAMSGNLCRCGTYPRILRAIRRAAAEGGSHDAS